MIEGVAAAIVVAEKAVKSANELKKKEMGKLPDEIDELDLLEGGLAIAEVATSGGVSEIASESLSIEDVKGMPTEIGEGHEIPTLDDLQDLPDEIDEEHLNHLIQSESPSEIKVDENHDNFDTMDGEIDGSNQDVSSSETDDKTAAESDTKSGETTETDEPQEKKGGSYRDVKKTSDGETHEVHHMPADSSTDLERDDGPAIKMEKDDHRQTASCGNSREAREYRERQRELIEQGKFREALQMDIDDLHEKFGDKYDDAIAEMLEYVDQLEKEGKING